MDIFKHKMNFKNGVKISDFLGNGTTFEIDTADNESVDESTDIDFTHFDGSEDHIIPTDQPFEELKGKMDLVTEGVWKKIYKAAPAKSQRVVDFSRHRVTYHRNLYMENESHPFDSTWLNRKPDVINNNETFKFLEGILDALSTMKEGEQSYFVISYTKMFKEKGCEPRVSPCADIFCDLKVLKIEEIGDENSINQLQDTSVKQPFESAKVIYNDGRLRAKNFFENKKTDSAIKIYEKIAQMLDFCNTKNENEIRERKEMMMQNFTNLGTCYNLRDEPNKTMSVIRQIEALSDDINNNSKVLFIKGKALRMIGEYKLSSIALEQAYRLSPNNSAICIEMEKLDKCISSYKELTKKFSEKLFIS